MHRDVESSVQKRHGHGDIAVHSEGSIKMIQGMDHLHNDVRLRQLGLLSLEKRRPRRNLANVHEYLKGGCKKDQARLLSVVPHARKGGNRQKVKHRRFHQNIRKHYVSDGALAQGLKDIISSLPWGSPKAAWMWAWAPCLGRPSWSRGGTRGALRSLSNSIIL